MTERPDRFSQQATIRYENDSLHKLKRAMVSPLLHPLGPKLMCPHPDCPEYTSLRLRILNFSIRLKSEGRA
jgi:hypothetical protein